MVLPQNLMKMSLHQSRIILIIQIIPIFTYCDKDIDLISEQLSIPWEPSKTVPFSPIIPYLGFNWNLPEHMVTITENKKNKYSSVIRDWLSHPT